MRPAPAVRAARGGLAGRRLQAVVIGLVLLAASAASTLALGLLADSSTPFRHAFTAQRGAQVTVTADTAVASARQLAATGSAAGVTAVAGPFPQDTVTAAISTPGVAGAVDQSVTLTGRASPGGPVDDLALVAGRWARRPGEIVWAQTRTGAPAVLGEQVTVPGARGSPRLTVVGLATSVTESAQAWVLPAELRALHGPPAAQLLYRFRQAGTAAQVAADVAGLRAALPRGALLGSPESWLTAGQQAASQVAPWVPFIVAFGIIGLVMSVLIVVNVVGGAVAAGTHRIGVLKAVGFTPAQVVAAYVLQVAAPAAVGGAAGAVAGNLLAMPLLRTNAQVYGVGSLGVPAWADVTVPMAMLAVACVAALLPALRAGRLSAVRAIATGRAPRAARGYVALRLLGRVPRLPRPVAIGLAGPFARPGRTLVTFTAIGFGAVAVIFGAGLATSLSRASADLSRARAQPVQVQLGLPGGPVKPAAPAPVTPAQQRAVAAALRAQPGTARYTPETDARLTVPGLARPLSVTAFGGASGWTGYALVTGRWYAGPGQADVNTFFLTATGTAVGGTYTLSSGGRSARVKIVGEVFEPRTAAELLTSAATLAAVAPGQVPQHYDVGLRPGTSAPAYASRLSAALGPADGVSLNTGRSPLFASVLVLVAALTVLLMAVAGLGVLNTVVVQVRERVHDLGVFKAIGMTPRQVTVLVVCSVAAIGLAAGVIAVPAGIALHRLVVPVMGHAASSNVPGSLLTVYGPGELAGLALAGLVIAVAGALGPATWAARGAAAAALRAE